MSEEYEGVKHVGCWRGGGRWRCFLYLQGGGRAEVEVDEVEAPRAEHLELDRVGMALFTLDPSAKCRVTARAAGPELSRLLTALRCG